MKKIALMDKHAPTFTEGENFKQYANSFIKRGLEVFQLDPYTINFESQKGNSYKINLENNQFYKENKSNLTDLNQFDMIMDLSDIIDLDFAINLKKIDSIHINDPLETYFSANKKIYAKRYNKFVPKTIVSSNINKLEKALQDEFEGTMIAKDPFGSCGKGVEKITKDNKYLLEEMTENGTKQIVAQKFMHLAKEGSKRVAVIGNPKKPESYRILHFYGRKPLPGEWKDNLTNGGKAIDLQNIRGNEKKLCLNVAKKSGLYLMGLDIMDDINEKGQIIPRLVETNSVLALAKGKYPEKIDEAVNFLVGEILK